MGAKIKFKKKNGSCPAKVSVAGGAELRFRLSCRTQRDDKTPPVFPLSLSLSLLFGTWLLRPCV